MPGYLIDANLPYYFAVWQESNYLHVRDLDEGWTDSQVWAYAKAHELTIVSKDADFSDRILVSDPPPRVIHIKLGNMKMKDFYLAVSRIWSQVCELSLDYKLVQVFPDRIEGID